MDLCGRVIQLLSLFLALIAMQSICLADNCASRFRTLDLPEISKLVSTEHFPISEPLSRGLGVAPYHSMVGKVLTYETPNLITEVISIEKRPFFTKEFGEWVKTKRNVDHKVLKRLQEFSDFAFVNDRVGGPSLHKLYHSTEIQDQVRKIGKLRYEYGESGYERFVNYALSAVYFAKSQFSRREWKTEFLNELTAFAHLAWRSSKYVIIRERLADGKPGLIVGTFRLIVGSPAVEQLRESDPSFLLFNRTVKHELPAIQFTAGVHSGHKIVEALEPGTLALKKGSPPETWATLMNHILTLVFDPAYTAEHNFDRRMLYTFGTEKSIRLLRPLFGFKKTSNPPKRRHGEDWFLLSTSPKEFVDSIQKNPQYQTQYGLEQLIQLFNELDGYSFANLKAIVDKP